MRVRVFRATPQQLWFSGADAKDANIQNAYGVGAIPHTVIIDGSGVIRFNEVGFTLDTPEVFRAEIRSLLPKAQ